MAERKPVPPPTPASWSRFMSKVAVDAGSGCWAWTGGTFSSGYGCFSLDREARRAHRVLYVWTCGELPPGRHLDHLCRNKACVNPAHLEPVTARENNRRSPLTLAGLNIRKSHCKSGHLFDEANTKQRTVRGAVVGRACRTCDNAKAAAYRVRREARVQTGKGEHMPKDAAA